MARAAAAAGTVMCLSTLATARPGEVAAAAPGGPALVPALLLQRRGGDPGADGRGGRVRLRGDRRHRRRPAGRQPRARPAAPASRSPRGSACPASQAALGAEPGGDDRGDLRPDGPGAGLGRPRGRSPPSAGCRSWSRACSPREDAALAVEHGAAGVVVSNHGGRQLDRVAGHRRRPARGGRRGRRAGAGARRRRHPPRRRRRDRARPRRRRGAGRPARPLGPGGRRRGGRAAGAGDAPRRARAGPGALRLRLAGASSTRAHVQRAPAASVYSG